MAVVEVKVVPVGTDQASFSRIVAACYRVVEMGSDKLSHTLTPTSTILEGPLEQTLAAARAMHLVPFGHGAERVVTTITIDERHDKPQTLEQMVEAVWADASR